MHFTENDYTSMTLFKMRHQELMAKADKERLAHQNKNQTNRRSRRAVRINNN